MNLTADFFRCDPVTCARGLVGCEFVWNGVGGVIVETEAYSVLNDEACHTFFRPSARHFVQSNPPGSAYVYLNYGMHWLLNFLVRGGREDGFVLIRALEPTQGVTTMMQRRNMTTLKNLCSGPGKLTRALGIDGSVHGRNLLADAGASFQWPATNQKVHDCVRVGITRSAELPWRFVLAGNSFLSVPVGRKAVSH